MNNLCTQQALQKQSKRKKEEEEENYIFLRNGYEDYNHIDMTDIALRQRKRSVTDQKVTQKCSPSEASTLQHALFFFLFALTLSLRVYQSSSDQRQAS